jgi:hypothetical protein
MEAELFDIRVTELGGIWFWHRLKHCLVGCRIEEQLVRHSGQVSVLPASANAAQPQMAVAREEVFRIEARRSIV